MAKKLNFVIDELRWKYEDIEERLSFVMGVQSRLSKGVGVSKDELMECEYILKEMNCYG